MSVIERQVIVDRDVLERFRIEVQALAQLERLRFGGDTEYAEHIEGIVGRFERACSVWDVHDDEDGVRLDRLACDRAAEVHRDLLQEELSAYQVSDTRTSGHEAVAS